MHSLIHPTAYEVLESDTLLTEAIFSFIASPFIQNWIAVFLVFFQAIYINRLVIKHRMANKITLLPGLLYIILVSLLPEYAILSPFLIANTFILFTINEMYITYKKQEAADTLFNIGFLLGLATAFVPNYIFLLLVGLIGLFIMRSLKVVEIFQLVSGTLVFITLAGGLLWLWDLSIFGELKKIDFAFHVSILGIRGAAFYKLLALLAISVFTILSYSKYAFKRSIQIQKNMDVLYWFMMASFFIQFLFTSMLAAQVLLLIIPFSILLNNNFSEIKSLFIQEIIHLVMLALVFSFTFGLI